MNTNCASISLNNVTAGAGNYAFLLCIAVSASVIAAPAGAAAVWSLEDGGNGHYYNAVQTPGGISWFAADAAARGAGGHLASINSSAENDFVFQLVNQPQLWRGVPEFNISLGPWLGGYQPVGSPEPAGNWKWVTSEPFSYTAWRSGEPSNAGFEGEENHLHYFAGPVGVRSRTWNDSTGTTQMFGYVVEFSCPVQPLQTTPPHPNQRPYNSADLSDELRVAVDRFQQLTLAEPGNQTFVPTSGLRSTDYQAHLYELRTTFLELDKVPGVVGYKDATQGQNGRPQLRIEPGSAGDACGTLIEEVNEEIRRHQLKPGDRGAPAVNPPGLSLHEQGMAIDVTITGVTAARRRELAKQAGLIERYPVKDPGHYELSGQPAKTQGVITGNSPINLLVEDAMGRRIGFDATSGQVVNDFGEYAEYSGPGSEPQVILIPLGSVIAGDYLITGTGTGAGPFSIRATVYDDIESGVPIRDWLVGGGVASQGLGIGEFRTQLAIPEPTSLSLIGLALAIFVASPHWLRKVARRRD